MAIIYNPSSLSNKSIEDLDAFTKEGGGIIWFQGENRKLVEDQGDNDILDFPENIKVVESGQGFSLQK